MLKHPDNGCAFLCLFPRRSYAHARLRIESTSSSSLWLFLDLRKMFLSRILSIDFSIDSSTFHSPRVNHNYLRLSWQIVMPHNFSRSCPLSLSLSLSLVDHFTLHLARLDLISPLVGSTRQRISPRTVAHSTCIPRGTQIIRTQIRTHTYIYTPTQVYERSRDERTHGADDSVCAATTTGKLNGGGVCTFRRLYATKEESAAAVATAAAHYIAWRTLVPVLAPVALADRYSRLR